MSIALTPALPASMTSSSIAPRVVNPLTTRVTTTFEDSYYRRIAYTAAMCVSRRARLVASIHETGVNIWRVLCIPDSDIIVNGVDPSTDPETRTSWEKVLEMDLNVRTNLIASALSDDGRWLVVSDLYEAKLFQLSFNVSSADIKPVNVLPDLSYFSLLVSSNRAGCGHLHQYWRIESLPRALRILSRLVDHHLHSPQTLQN